MSEFIKETVTTTQKNFIEPTTTTGAKLNTSVNDASIFQSIEYLVYFFFGLLDVLLIARLLLKVSGASASSDFVSAIYAFTSIFVVPFEGIFRVGYAKGVETTAVFEPSTLVAIIVYAVIAVGIVMLLRILSGKKQVA